MTQTLLSNGATAAPYDGFDGVPLGGEKPTAKSVMLRSWELPRTSRFMPKSLPPSLFS